jgi:DNA-binding CsgD family transcriptional regulator
MERSAPTDRLQTLIEIFGARHRLSRREQQVLALGARGLLLKEAAHELECSRRTVEEYWQRIFAKVSMRTKGEILARLLRLATTELAAADPEERFNPNPAPAPK